MAFGGPAGELANTLMSLGPEGAKTMIKEFAETLPDLVVTLVETLSASADVIIESLIDSLLIRGGLERIVVALIQAVPRIAYKLVESIVRGLNNAVVAMGQRFGVSFQKMISLDEFLQKLASFYQSYFNAIKSFFTSYYNSLYSIFNNLRTGLKSIFEWLPNAIKRAITPSISGSSPGGAAKSGVGSIPIIGQYMKNGGLVYAANGFVPRGTDTVPAMLTPGERVLTVQQNQSFEQLPMILAQLVSVLSSPMTTETSIEIDGNRLADVILQLNRRNARVA